MARDPRLDVAVLAVALAALGAAGTWAASLDTSGVDQTMRAWIESSCQAARSLGPSYYYPCVERELEALKKPSASIDLSKVDPERRSWIESSCRAAQSLGPSYYYPCLDRELQVVLGGRSFQGAPYASPLPRTPTSPPLSVERLQGPLALKPRGGTAAVPTAPPPTAQISAPLPTAPVDVSFPKGPPRPDDIAVIVGNADYGRLGRDIPNVTPAYADAAGIRRYVTEALGIREGNIIELKDATSAQLVQVFGSERNPRGKLHDWVRPGVSKVFVYYAGHGAPAGADGSAFLVPSDAESQRIELSGYPLATLYNNLGQIPARSVTVVLEACFSGVSQGGAVVRLASPAYLKPKVPALPPNLTVIAAGEADQMASWEPDSSRSLFTTYFLKAMSGEADRQPHGNGDGTVDLAEIDRYLKATLTYYARRHYGRDQVAQIVPAQSR